MYFISAIYIVSYLHTNFMLMIQIRPNAVSLVDSFDYTDHYLGSALGRYDGNVYSTLYKEAWKDPLNELLVTEGYNEFIRPILMKGLQLSQSRM